MRSLDSLTDRVDESRKHLRERLDLLEIPSSFCPYPESKTVEEGKLLRGDMPGTFTKNLLLKDKKHQYYLLSIHEDQVLDLKVLHKQIGAKGRLGFAQSDFMIEHLGVAPGALTPLALINDDNVLVTAVIDASLMETEQVNFHPLINTESVGLHPQELLAFIRSCNREPVLIDFNATVSELSD